MHIKHWKKIAFFVSFSVHFYLWYANIFSDFTLNEIHNSSNSLFSISATLIGFIFAVIAILVTITDNPLKRRFIHLNNHQPLIEILFLDHIYFLLHK